MISSPVVLTTRFIHIHVVIWLPCWISTMTLYWVPQRCYAQWRRLRLWYNYTGSRYNQRQLVLMEYHQECWSELLHLLLLPCPSCPVQSWRSLLLCQFLKENVATCHLISLLCILSKLIEKHMYSSNLQQLNSSSNMLMDQQWGFTQNV